jgi:hypothetical protein
MSHTINYCLSLTGEELFSLLSREKIFSDENFEYFIENDLNLEINLFRIEALIEFSGTTIVIWTPWNYTKFINDEDTKNQVLDWENELKSKLINQSILRVDEILLNNFSQETSDVWFVNEKSFSDLFFWLKGQNNLHWSKIN